MADKLAGRLYICFRRISKMKSATIRNLFETYMKAK
jgi:hypothetical protein